MTTAVGENLTDEQLLQLFEPDPTQGDDTVAPTVPTFLDLTEDDDDRNLIINELDSFSGGLRALSGDDTVIGSSSSEVMNGNRGFDRLFGRGGNDTLRGGRDRDILFGEINNDLLNGNLGDDFVSGGAGQDTLRGGQDDDILVGGDRNDVLIGDYGTDYLIGNQGDDRFVLRTETGESLPQLADWLIDFNPNDDRIGLTGNLSEDNLAFETITLELEPRLTFIQSFTGEDISNNTGINILTLDPDSDGNVSGTLIRNNDENSDYFQTILGIVLNLNAIDLTGRFQTVSDSVLERG